jgi:hypothetical protein
VAQVRDLDALRAAHLDQRLVDAARDLAAVELEQLAVQREARLRGA